jgi:N-acetylglucosaminyldiphosphoundecaprenol N-acetyl-beta-D-mannosaminyltransferase
MQRDTVIILGIPIDNVTLAEAVERIFAMIEKFRNDAVPREVATVNVDFIVNTLSWQRGGIRHPELLDILRRADMVTADGMPVVWMSRLLGCPLKERVTGADMVPALAAAAAERGASLFFLGGNGDVGQRAADQLVRNNPGLRIAGVSSPFVYTEGEHLADFEEEDAAIIAEINAAHPDILLIAFGNPKQELWFARNAPRLKVPVSIGIGGTFEFIVGTVSRAPLWVQNAGLEWIYRILMEPRRLWKRYAVGMVKFALHAWPAIRIYQAARGRKAVTSVPVARGSNTAVQRIEEDVCIITLPVRFDALAVKELTPRIEEAYQTYRHLVLNFEQVQMVDSSGLGFLVRLWRRDLEKKGKLNLIAVNDLVKEFFRFNRVADMFHERLFGDQKMAMARIRTERLTDNAPYTLTSLSNGTVVVGLRGRVDAVAMKNFPFDELLPQLEGHDSILDLSCLEFADSSGLVAFHRIQRHVAKHGGESILCAPNEAVLQLLHLTRLDRLFTITNDQLILTDRRES